MIKILIVDDSDTEIAILKNLFKSASDMEVIGVAKNGKEAIELVKLLKPDIITMDIQMPIMNGFEATRQILASNPTPIVIISSKLQDQSLQATYKALEAGALSVLEKPIDINSSKYSYKIKHIIDTIRSMAEIKVIKRRFIIKKADLPKYSLTNEVKKNHFEIVAIGTSIGGPQALKIILSNLPANFPVPIVIVQHMTNGFIDGFSNWLDNNTNLNIKTATQNEKLIKGTVYFAPDNVHLEVKRMDEELIAHLVNSPSVSGFCPSATVLLSSVAKTCGKNAIGILLTGMGNDGAKGLLELKQAHGHTLIQDSDNSVVFGMGSVAQSLGAVDKVIELAEISTYLNACFQQK